MAQRKLQQEIDKTFKKVAEGIQTFEGIFDKIQQTTNASQKEKLEDALKREIKKLQRHRDQIKTWAAGNEIKDKKPLLEQRKLIEAQMEKFKAVEKEMKTKAFSKEGLSAAAKLDPKEKEKMETIEFLSNMVEELERQIETLEAEEESLQATVKKGKKDTGKADRLSEITRMTERHKFHQGKLELVLRSVQNGKLETEQVHDIEDGIRYYVEENQSVEFIEDDGLYDELTLEEEEGVFGIGAEIDKVSSQDAQSIPDDQPDATEVRSHSTSGGKQKSSSISEPSTAAARRPSNNFKSPLPALATLHTPAGAAPSASTDKSMKPAPPPSRPPGETLKYASAAAAAAAAVTEKGAVGIAPLPPPPGAASNTSTAPPPGLPPSSNQKPATSTSSVPTQPSALPTASTSFKAPVAAPSLEAASDMKAKTRTPPPLQTQVNGSLANPRLQNAPLPPAGVTRPPSVPKASASPQPSSKSLESSNAAQPTISANVDAPPGVTQSNGVHVRNEEPESVYHLPPGLQDLLQSFENTKSRPLAPDSPFVRSIIEASANNRPNYMDAEKPHHYRPETKFKTPDYYPQEPFIYADDPALYSKIDTETLFYIFYYQQNTYQQYMAAKALKSQSWRFHKQYQTWFQRHEEPKNITEEYEQGTYRFFDYESTWMNRRKADFRFAYKFLEDDL